MFATHFHYEWIKPNKGGLFGSTASFIDNGTVSDAPADYNVDTSFPKGASFAQWLTNNGGSTTPGIIQLREVRRNVQTVDANVSRRWIYSAQNNETKYYSFNMPLTEPPEKQCGRVVYTDIHVSSGDNSGGTFPNNCTTRDYSPQEKALLFLLFDLSACITDDKKPPAPPAVVPR